MIPLRINVKIINKNFIYMIYLCIVIENNSFSALLTKNKFSKAKKEVEEKGKKTLPQDGFEIYIIVPGNFVAKNSAPSLRDPVPDIPWTVATWFKKIQSFLC